MPGQDDERLVALHLRPGKTFSVDVETTRSEPYPARIRRLVEVRDRVANRVLGTTEHGESAVVDLASGYVLLWICGGWLGAVGASGGAERTASGEAQRMAFEREQRDLAAQINREIGLPV